MLTFTVNLFNFIGGLLNAVFISSYSLGKVMFTLSYQAAKFLLSVVTHIANSLTTLFEGFQIFWADVSTSINKFSLAISDGAAETLANIYHGTILFKDKLILYMTRRLGIGDFIMDAFFVLKGILNTILGAISLLSDVLWFILMILPTVVYYLGMLLLTMLRIAMNGILMGCSSLTSLSAEIYTLTVMRLKDKPVRTFVELTVVLLLLKNSLLVIFTIKAIAAYWYTATRVLLGRLVNSRLFRLVSRRPVHRRAQPVEDQRTFGASSETSPRKPSRTSDTKRYVDEGTLCVICQERQRCIVLFPCKHLCMCNDCANSLTSYQNTCPLCRNYINSRLKIYV